MIPTLLVALVVGSLMPSEPGPDSGPGAPECGVVPQGMACVPAGPFLRGSSVDLPAEAPMDVVTLDAFYIDINEVTNRQYAECVKAGVCKKPEPFKGFQEPEQPVMPVTWTMADQYCRWAGKRLPSEAEWEKAARGTSGAVWPWGNSKPTCAKAHYQGCKPDVTRPVGSFPANEYGIHDMAGNSFEWVNDWYSDCYTGCKGACGDECLGVNPKGPCDGAASCPGHSKRVLKGGSWYWDADQMRPARRRGNNPESGGHRLGFRCAMSGPQGDPQHSLPVHSDFGPVPEAWREHLVAIPEDDLPEKRLQGAHYVTGNEWRYDLFVPYIRNVHGALVGVGADQNFTLAAIAESELIFAFDYDLDVVMIDKVHVVFLKQADTRADFLALWNQEVSSPKVEDILKQEFGEQAKEYVAIYKQYSKQVFAFAKRNMEYAQEGKRNYWLGSESDYKFISSLARQGRIVILKGDLLAGKAVSGIGEALKKIGMPANVIYMSNCEEYWSYYSEGLEQSFGTLPVSSKSVVIRTFHDTKLPKAKPDNYYHYNVQNASHFQQEIGKQGRTRYRGMMQGVKKLGKNGEFSILGFDVD